MKKSHLMFWEQIAALAGIKNPERRAAQVIQKWEKEVVTSEASQKIIADLTAARFPSHLTGADVKKVFQLNARLVFR